MEGRAALGTAGCLPVLHGLSPEYQDYARMSEKEIYENPLINRYASREMAELWGPQRKFSTWRRLWLALAEAQHELGLPADDGVAPRIRPSSFKSFEITWMTLISLGPMNSSGKCGMT